MTPLDVHEALSATRIDTHKGCWFLGNLPDTPQSATCATHETGPSQPNDASLIRHGWGGAGTLLVTASQPTADPKGTGAFGRPSDKQASSVPANQANPPPREDSQCLAPSRTGSPYPRSQNRMASPCRHRPCSALAREHSESGGQTQNAVGCILQRPSSERWRARFDLGTDLRSTPTGVAAQERFAPNRYGASNQTTERLPDV